MRRDSFKLLVLAGLLGFAVLYGMELSSKGIENVKGPWETPPAEYDQGNAAEDDWTLPATGKPRNADETSGRARTDDGETESGEPESFGEESDIPRDDREPIVDRVSGKTGEVLHDLSRNGIRFVVSWFDKVLG